MNKIPLLALGCFFVPAASAAVGVEDVKDADVCSYRWDVEADPKFKSRTTCELDVNIGVLKIEQAEFLAKVAARKEEVLKVYRALQDPALKGLKDDKDAAKSSRALDQIASSRPSEPINERTFPAWCPQIEGCSPSDLTAVYGRWIAGVNSELRQEMGKTPDEARREQIKILLASNKVMLDGLKDLEKPDRFKCWIGERCAAGGAVGAPAVTVFTAQSRDFKIDKNGQPYRLAMKVPGGSLDGAAPPPASAPSAGAPAGPGAGWGIPVALTGLFAGSLLAWKFRGARQEVEGQEAQAKRREEENARFQGDYRALLARQPSPLRVEPGYEPTREELIVIFDVLEHAKLSGVAEVERIRLVQNYISSKMTFGGYGPHEGKDYREAAERIYSKVGKFELAFNQKS